MLIKNHKNTKRVTMKHILQKFTSRILFLCIFVLFSPLATNVFASKMYYTENDELDFVENFNPDLFIISDEEERDREQTEGFAMAIKKYTKKNEHVDVIQIIVTNAAAFLSLCDLQNLRLANKAICNDCVDPLLSDSLQGVIIASDNIAKTIDTKNLGKFFIKFNNIRDPKLINKKAMLSIEEDKFLKYVEKFACNINTMFLEFNAKHFSGTFLESFMKCCADKKAISKLKKCTVFMKNLQHEQPAFSNCLNYALYNNNNCPYLKFAIKNNLAKYTPYTNFFDVIQIPPKKVLSLALKFCEVNFARENGLKKFLARPSCHLKNLTIDPLCDKHEQIIETCSNVQAKNLSSLDVTLFNEKPLDAVGDLINKATALKTITLTDTFGTKIVINDAFLKYLTAKPANTSVKNIAFKGIFFSQNILVKIFEKFSQLKHINLSNCFIYNLSNFTLENGSIFPTIKSITISHDEQREREDSYFTITGLTNLVKHCPNLEELTISQYSLLIQNTQEDLSDLLLFIDTYAHIIKELNICISYVNANAILGDNNAINLYKNQLKEGTIRALSKKQIPDATVNLKDCSNDMFLDTNVKTLLVIQIVKV